MQQNNDSNQSLPGDPALPSSDTELLALMAADQGRSTYQVEDFFRLPEKNRYQLSPDGKLFSWLGPHERRLNLFVQETGLASPRRLTDIKDRDIAWYFWKGNDQLVFAKDEGGNENFHLYAVGVNGGDTRRLTPYEGVRINLIDDLEEQEDEIVIEMNKNNPALFEPYRLNIHTGELRQLAVNDNESEPLDSWMTDHEGRIRIASRLSGGTNTSLLYRNDEADDFKVVLTTDFRESVSPLFFDFDNPQVVYAASNVGRDKSAIVKLDLLSGTETGAPIFSHPDVDVTHMSYSLKKRVPTLVTYNTDKRHFHFLDETTRQLYARLEQALPGYEVVTAGKNRAEDKFMIRTYSDRSLGAYYLFDLEKDELTLLSVVSPWLDERDMAQMKPVSYTSRDGLVIHGYLTLPPNVEPVNLPLVVNPHGGPWVRDHWGYNPEVQLLASRGFAVFQMNYRGSTGYGRKFWEAGFRQWGRSMQDDITDGVYWLIEQGIANPGAVAIYGGSYGGYATLAGVTFTPQLYACAIDYVGVSNLFTFMNTIPPYWKPYLEMMYEMVGNPEKHKDEMYAASPIFHTEKIRTPLFVVQGANDPRVNIAESDQIVTALRRRGVEVL
ncbi:MAG: hypothetical protein RI973_489, partial [Bacteroidota bacterium]